MIFDAIRESHDLQRDLCRKLTASRGEIAARELLFLQLKVELMAHAAAEERALYVPLLMTDAGLDASRHALHERPRGRRAARKLSVRDKKQAGWLATAKTLSYKVRHHLKEEESKFFRVAGRLLSATKRSQLAHQRPARCDACVGITPATTGASPLPPTQNSCGPPTIELTDRAGVETRAQARS